MCSFSIIFAHDARYKSENSLWYLSRLWRTRIPNECHIVWRSEMPFVARRIVLSSRFAHDVEGIRWLRHRRICRVARKSLACVHRGRLALCGRAGRVTLPCGYAERGALGECTLLVMARRSASLPWRRLSIIVNKNASNEQNADKIVTVLNKFSYYAKGYEAAEEAQKAIAERAKVKADG